MAFALYYSIVFMERRHCVMDLGVLKDVSLKQAHKFAIQILKSKIFKKH